MSTKFLNDLNKSTSQSMSKIGTNYNDAQSTFNNIDSLFNQDKARMSPDKLLADIESFARNNRFAVKIPLPTVLSGTYTSNYMSAVCIQCASVNLPNSALATFGYRNVGPVQKRPYDVLFTDISMTFRVDSRFYSRKIFQDWIGGISNGTGNSFRYLEEYAVDFEITPIDNLGNDAMKIKVIDAYPSSITAINLDENASDQIVEFTVNFVYTRWEEEKVNNSQGQGLSSVFQ